MGYGARASTHTTVALDDRWLSEVEAKKKPRPKPRLF
jgi:hypothetical protein